jgi:hypothetical protein
MELGPNTWPDIPVPGKDVPGAIPRMPIAFLPIAWPKKPIPCPLLSASKHAPNPLQTTGVGFVSGYATAGEGFDPLAMTNERIVTDNSAPPRVMAARRLDMIHTSFSDEPFVDNGEKAVR